MTPEELIERLTAAAMSVGEGDANIYHYMKESILMIRELLAYIESLENTLAEV